MGALRKVLFQKLAESSDQNGEVTTDMSREDRVAYRLGYEATLAWQAHEYAKLEAFRNRASVFLSATVVAVGAGIGISGAAVSGAERGCLTWIGLLVAVTGFLACLVAAIGLMRPVRGPFEISPKTLVEEYGDDITEYPTNDSTYRILALWGGCKCDELTVALNRRCQWLNLSMGGLPLAVAGVMLLWADGI